MKLNKKTSLPLLLTMAGSILFSSNVAGAYQPVEVKIPFTFKNFESEDARNYSLTIREVGSKEVKEITYNIANQNTQYYKMQFTQPGSYEYEITFNAFDTKTTYNLNVEVQTTSENVLVSGFYITKPGTPGKVGLEFVEEPDTPSTKPSDKPSEKPSDKPSEKPSDKPSDTPSVNPSDFPSWRPSDKPSDRPSEKPSETPSVKPSEMPSENPSDNPSVKPSETPSDIPSVLPSEKPSDKPSSKPPVIIPSIGSSNDPSQVVIVKPAPSPSGGVQTGDDYLPLLTVGGIGTAFLTLGVVLFKKKK